MNGYTHYDLAAIGNDEAAFEVLTQAADSGRRCLALLPDARHSSWLCSLALRNLAGELLVDRNRERRSLYHRSGSPQLLRRLISQAVSTEIADLVSLLQFRGIQTIFGESRFDPQRCLRIYNSASMSIHTVHADSIVIATGLRHTSLHPSLGLLPFQSTESLLTSERFPRQLTLLGGGDFTAGLAGLLSLFGVDLSLFTEDDPASAMLELARACGVKVFTRRDLSELDALQTARSADHATIDCRRSIGFTDHLALEQIGIEPDEHGRLWCSSSMETWCPGVFGVGDVVGFSTSSSDHSVRQAERLLQSIPHRIPRPHFLRNRVLKEVSGLGFDDDHVDA